jgi:hypothetical protein
MISWFFGNATPIIGVARVSTGSQDLDLQKMAIEFPAASSTAVVSVNGSWLQRGTGDVTMMTERITRVNRGNTKGESETNACH